ncbi:MAG: hypothetical protein GC161_05170 [Planctomycetaceae bacterium]|nr:hypothetical protein [Planctomycetaceae bacterium]
MWSRALAALLLLLAAPGALAQTGWFPTRPFHPAAEGTWPTADGSLARSRSTETHLPRGPLHLAGSLDFAGALLGEPVVDGDLCVVATAMDGGTSQLTLVDLRYFAALGEPLTLSHAEPDPTLVGDRLVFRRDADTIVLATCSPLGLAVERTWSVPGARSVLFDGTTLWCSTWDRLLRRNWDDDTTTASLELRTLNRLLLASGAFWVVAWDGGEAYVLAKVTPDLRDVQWVEPALPAQSVWDGGRALRFFTNGHRSYLDGASVRMDGFQAPWLTIGLGAGFRDNKLLLDPSADAIDQTPLLAEEQVLHWMKRADEPRDALVRIDIQNRFVELAHSEAVPPLQRAAMSPVLAGNGLVVDGRAGDGKTGKTLWQLPAPVPLAVVPSRHGLLVQRAGGVLELHADESRRPAHRAAPAAWPDDPAWTALLVASGAAAADLAGRTVLRGPLEVVEDGLRAVDAKTKARSGRARGRAASDGPAPAVAREEFGALLVADGRARGVRSWTGFLAASREVVRTLEAGAVEELTATAAGSLDKDLLVRLLELARRAGPAESVPKLEAGLERAQRARRAPVAESVQAVEARLETLRAECDGFREQSFRALVSEDPDDLVLQALVEAGDDGLLRPVALARLGELLPPGMALDPEQPLDGLVELLRLHLRSPIHLVEPPADTNAPATRAERHLAQALASWRSDLVALRTRDILLLTPFENLSAIADGLAHAQLLCDVLARELGAPAEDAEVAGAAGSERERLAVRLYSSSEEYQAMVGQRWPHLDPMAEFSSGHYDPAARQSLFVVPAEGSEFAEVRSVFLHELAHQWLEERWLAGGGNWDGRITPAYWVVEGLACMVQGWQFDTRAWSVHTAGDRGGFLDLVASTDPAQLLPWDALLGSDQRWVWGVAGETLATVRSRARLNRPMPLTGAGLFYAQSAALCGALHSGPRRAAFLEYARRHHLGEAGGPSLVEALGLDADELGELARQFALSVR